MSAVEQLANGVQVTCADGQVITCKPLTLKTAKQIIDLWDQRFDPQSTVIVRARARLQIARIFADAYPELVDHISPGDIETLLPDFFWSATGASVPAAAAPETTPTGTPASANTAPPGASSPTG